MEVVSFIDTSASPSKDDLILSFVLRDSRFAGGVRSLVLLRSPKHETVFDDDERGVTVNMEGERNSLHDVRSSLLREFRLDPTGARAEVKTSRKSYELDLHAVDENELKEMKKLLQKMNFDGRVKLAGI